MEKLKKYFRIALYIAIPLIFGGIGYILSGGTKIYGEINKPFFFFIFFLFPIVWTILYILMGVSHFMISKYKDNTKANVLYFTQLVFNAIWPLLFFRWKMFLISSIWLLVLLLLVLSMKKEFIKLDKTAGNLQIPYVIWLIFATILNFSIYFLN